MEITSSTIEVDPQVREVNCRFLELRQADIEEFVADIEKEISILHCEARTTATRGAFRSAIAAICRCAETWGVLPGGAGGGN